jgi:HEAT repeat protein
LGQITSEALQKELAQVITIMAKKDLGPLETLLDHHEESLLKRLIDIVGSLEGQRPLELILKMTRHRSEGIRRRALKHLMARDPQAIKRFFPFIDDPSKAVRHVILEQLGRSRNERAEGLLLDYLLQRQSEPIEHDHLLACYRALGRCGSSRCIPSLQGLLFDRRWIPGSGTYLHRKGAAIALMMLGTGEATKTLERASRSLMPGVRLAYRKALEATQQHVRFSQ